MTRPFVPLFCLLVAVNVLPPHVKGELTEVDEAEDAYDLLDSPLLSERSAVESAELDTSLTNEDLEGEVTIIKRQHPYRSYYFYTSEIRRLDQEVRQCFRQMGWPYNPYPSNNYVNHYNYGGGGSRWGGRGAH
nr:hypothetical protein BaRGS_030513 [Batillaria attramentaria]